MGSVAARPGPANPASRARAWWVELRPDQWIKNAIVFAALVFGKRLFDPESVVLAVQAFLAFCAASSAVYLWNDVQDRERDALHPEKRQRPVASGAISAPAASAAAAVLAAGALVLAATTAPAFAVIAGAYLALNLLYSTWLKHQVLVDVIAISLGFVLRAIGGAAAIDVEISPWLVVCTFMVMLFLALGKRRAELLVEGAGEHRPASRGYTLELLDQLMTVVVAATIVSYCLYTLSGEVRDRFGVEHLEATVPFVVYGLFRYLYLVRFSSLAGNPSRAVVSDRPLVVAVALWGAVVVALLYAGSAAAG